MSATNSPRWSTKLAALDANLLVALDALLQESNVTSAARRVGVTQSAMSQTLARLRHQFDDPILVKQGRYMVPTEFGLRIKARLRAAVAELEAVVADRPGFEEATATNRFVIACVDYLSLVLFPSIARSVATRAPRIDLAVHALDAVSIAPELQAGTVHLYVGVLGRMERALETQPLFLERLRVVVRKDHPLREDPVDLETFATAPHLLVSPRREAGSIVTRALAEAGYTRRVAVEVPYFALVPTLLEGSDLVATLPERLAEQFADAHDLEVLESPLPLPDVEIGMAWHPVFSADPAQRWLRSLVAEVARRME